MPTLPNVTSSADQYGAILFQDKIGATCWDVYVRGDMVACFTKEREAKEYAEYVYNQRQGCDNVDVIAKVE